MCLYGYIVLTIANTFLFDEYIQWIWLEDSNIFFLDFAVGAPYDGPNNQGAVYIFLGSRDGVMKKPSQVNTRSNVHIMVLLSSALSNVSLTDSLPTSITSVKLWSPGEWWDSWDRSYMTITILFATQILTNEHLHNLKVTNSMAMIASNSYRPVMTN